MDFWARNPTHLFTKLALHNNLVAPKLHPNPKPKTNNNNNKYETLNLVLRCCRYYVFWNPDMHKIHIFKIVLISNSITMR